MRAFTLAGLVALTLAACSGQRTPIRDFGAASISSFERDVVIQKELTMPSTFRTLPAPGGVNRADP